ncbi:MAG TPA: 3-isopropylmalate dehydratase small subunit [Bacillales bacterium]|nr:3-isopropylmalate dehydratase small subunit [Bacillales bacterium]
MIFSGNALVLGDNINTDLIIAGRHVASTDPIELSKYLFQDLDGDFINKIQYGDILIGGQNFGCGSSREHAPLAIKGAGISCVIAPSFSRIFFRNCINVGLPIIQCSKVNQVTKNFEKVRVNIKKGMAQNLTNGMEFKAQPIPDFIIGIMEAGGILEKIKKEMLQNN